MEEQELLPELQRVLSHEQLMQLGREFEWAKLVAPSRCVLVCGLCWQVGWARKTAVRRSPGSITAVRQGPRLSFRHL